jgi:hypothetical protein
LKPEWWGSPLVQEEKYQEKPVNREAEIVVAVTVVVVIVVIIVTNCKQ